MIRIGIAGWAIPKIYAHLFENGKTHLERYAKHFSITEINQTFYRLPQASTLHRWVQITPENFRFSCKLHRKFTHFHRLSSTDGLEEFIAVVKHLEEKLVGILVQLPPSLQYNEENAKRFFTTLKGYFEGIIVVEPRHKSWIEAEDLLVSLQIARVAADPPRYKVDNEPGGYKKFSYYRLHGFPKLYCSEYKNTFLQDLARKILIDKTEEKIVIFDNTACGYAIKNALQLMEIIDETQQN